MKLVLQQLGIEVECSCDEFKEIYPAISNGKAAIEPTQVAPLHTKSKAAVKEEKSPYRKGSNPQEVLEFMQKHPNKSFTAIDLVGKVTCTERTLHGVLSRLARDGRIKRSEKGHYTFFALTESDLEDAEPITIGNGIPRIIEESSQHAFEDASSIQTPQGEGVSIEPSEEMSEQTVKEMWKHVKPLFEIGKPIADSQIMKTFGNQNRKISYKWLVQACHTGLIEQDVSFSGFYKIVRPVEEGKETKPITKRYKKLTTEEREQLKEKILGVIDKHRLKSWLARDVQQSLGLAHRQTVLLLRELFEEGKIIHDEAKQTYHSLKADEPEIETIEQPIENTLSTEHEENMQQEESTSVI